MLSKIRFTMLWILTPFVLLAQSGSSFSDPFTSVGQAASITTPGIYYFNLGGHQFSTYVNGNGELLVAMNYGGAEAGPLTATAAMTNTQNAILTPDILLSLSGLSLIRITSNGTTNTSTTNPVLIARLQNNETLDIGGVDNALNATWQGSGDLFGSENGAAQTQYNHILSNNIVHPWGNVNALTWIPLDGTHRDVWGAGEPLSSYYLQLWVKGTGGTTQAAPVITSATTTNGTVGTPFGYQITASNSPTGFGAANLPPGLSVDAPTGLISGTPTVAGNFTVSISATNTGTGTANLTVTIAQTQTAPATWTDNGSGGIYNTILANNVGIGTTSPQDKLSVVGNIGIGGASFTSPGGQSGYGIAFPAALSDYQRIYGEHNGTNASNLVFHQADNPDDGVVFRNTDWVNGQVYDYMKICRGGLYYNGGNVLIGKTSQLNPGYKLDVAGNVRADDLTVNTTGADFVFDSSYRLAPLPEVEKYIGKNSHLPGIASASEMQANGIKVGESQTKLLQKIEELTLYMIQMEKEGGLNLDDMQRQINVLKEENRKLKTAIQKH